MALAHANSDAGIDDTGTPTTTFSITLSFSLTVGRHLVLVTSSMNDPITVSDDLGNTYIAQDNEYNVYCAYVDYSGTPTIDFSWTGNTQWPYVYAIEISGCSTVQPMTIFDDVIGAMSTSTTCVTPLLTDTRAGTLAIYKFYDQGTYGPGYWTGCSAGTGLANYLEMNPAWPNVVFYTATFASAPSNFSGQQTFTGVERQYDAQWYLLTPFGLKQEGFRFRNDDGSETTATWKENQDVVETGPSDTAFRLRFLIESIGGDPPTSPYQLEYKRDDDPEAIWKKVK